LLDVENLLADGDPDPELLTDRVFLLATLGQGTAARQRALEFLDAHPDSARGLELAGEACQVEYREQLTRTSDQLRTDLDYDQAPDALEAMKAYLYRPAGDAGVPTALLRLQEIYQREPRRRQTWLRLQETLREL